MTNIDLDIKLIYPDKDENIFSSLLKTINSLKIYLIESYSLPLYIIGGMYD